MTPPTHEQIDAAAAEAFATAEAAAKSAGEQPVAEGSAGEPAGPLAPTYPELGAGAQGADVQRLVNLLAYLGYADNNVVRGGAVEVDATVWADVHKAQSELGVVEPNIDGEVIGEATWSALYEAAEAKDEAAAAPAAGASSSG